MILLEK